MSPTTEERLRTALRTATDRIVAPPDLAERVTAGVPRRVARPGRGSRMALVLAPVAVVAVVAAAVFVVPRLGSDGAPAVAADEALLGRPTGGNLAADGTVRAAVVRAFLAQARPPEYRSGDLPTPQPGARADGPPHVVWVGRTLTGTAAVVAQRETGPAGAVVAIGFLGTVAGKLTVAAVSRRADGYYTLDASFVGTGSRTVLVLDRGAPASWAYRRTRLPGGGVRLRDIPIRFDGGVGVVEIPRQVDPREVELTRPGPPATTRPLSVGADPGALPEGPRLPWQGQKTDPEDVLFPVGTGAAGWPAPGQDGSRYFQLLYTLRGALDSLPSDIRVTGAQADDAWYAWGGTPDGTRLVATDVAAPGEPSRAYVVLLTAGRPPLVVDGGFVDRTASVPFRVKLPDGKGWLVAAEGRELSWRTGTGAWTPAGTDAALLPPAATEVRADEGTAVPLR